MKEDREVDFNQKKSREQEFVNAIDYFKAHPQDIKMKERVWVNRYGHVSEYFYLNWNKPGEPWDDNKIIALPYGVKEPLRATDNLHGITQKGFVYAIKIKEAQPPQKNGLRLAPILHIQADLLGPSMGTMLQETVQLSHEQKLNIARKSAWELRKKHEKGMNYLIKPSNIAIDEQQHVTLFDFKTTENRARETSSSSMMSLKKTLYEPNSDGKSLLTRAEYDGLSLSLKTQLITDEQEYKEDMLVDLAFFLAEEKLSFTSQQKDSSAKFTFPTEISENVENKKMVCELFSLIDRIEEFKYGDVEGKKDVADRYLSSMLNARNDQNFKQVEAELQVYIESMRLLKEIERHKINQNDTTMTDFIRDQSNELFKAEAPEERRAIQQTLAQALSAVKSKEVDIVKQQVKRLYRSSRLDVFQTAESKAKSIEKALIGVPILERHRAFSGHSTVQKACAQKRFYLLKSGVKGEKPDEDYAAGTFQKIKEALGQITHRPPNATIAEPNTHLKMVNKNTDEIQTLFDRFRQDATHDKLLLCRARDLLGAVLADMKHPSSHTKATCASRLATYQNALKTIPAETDEEVASLKKLNALFQPGTLTEPLQQMNPHHQINLK